MRLVKINEIFGFSETKWKMLRLIYIAVYIVKGDLRNHMIFEPFMYQAIKPKVGGISLMTKKSRILYLLKFLYEHSDEDNPVSSKDIIEHLTKQGFEIHRTTIGSDIAQLLEIGIDVVTLRSSPNRYFIGQRRLELMETKMLIDAVSASKFLTEKKSVALIKKIETLTSSAKARELHRGIDISRTIKPTNEKIYYTLDTIVNAIQNKHWIAFRYFEYTPDKEHVYKYDGYIYEVCPYTTFWRDDRYYVMGYSKKHEKVAVFRVDRLDHTAVCLHPWLAPPIDFDPTTCANEIFEMFDGEVVIVELKCDNELMDIVVDKFGEDVDVIRIDTDNFKATVSVRISPRFYGWVFGFADRVKILSPETVRCEYIEIAKSIVASDSQSQ